MTLAIDDPRHGTWHAYGHLGCRCDRCRKANADTKRARVHRPRPALPPDAPQHGTLHAYRYYRCRCGLCQAANTNDVRKRRARKS